MNRIFSFLFIIICSVNLWGQYDIPPKPTNDKSLIFDYSNQALLDIKEKDLLNQKLIEYEKKTSTQIIIVIIKNLKGEDENRLAVDWAHQWGVGQKGKDNGLIILLSVEDRRISIQNGYGLEQYMTDVKTRRIIDNYITPEFKKGNFYQGLDKGTDIIFRVLEGKFVEDKTSDSEEKVPMILVSFLIFCIIIYLVSRNNGGNSNNRGTRVGRDIIFTDFGRTTWGESSSGGSFGGGFGGFGGFGGGGFGGGGASGGW